jgi:hypothetical protein
VTAPAVSVRADYKHVTKLITPAPPFAVHGATLKWYDIAPADEPVPPDVHDVARSGVRNGAAMEQLELGGDLGFVILHRCRDGFYFLLTSTWQNENELWETVWAKNGPDELLFQLVPLDGTHRPTFCVWELAAVTHEQQAWTRYLRSERDAAARQTYLADSFAGEV